MDLGTQEAILRLVNSYGAEKLLVNAPATAETFAQAAAAAGDEVEPIADLHGSASYKREMVRVHVRRALERAL